MRIQVLPQTLINQIAAGEVVVRMASVLKELVENSLDAGSTHIQVEISKDCRDLTIADDGHGMDRDDAELCLQRHATSKVRKPEDLFNLTTRGFRGEAVPSIASVSRMEIQTRPESELCGTRVVVEGGDIERIESVGCPIGTRFVIRDLFYNTPARLKFLKSPISEMNAIMMTVTRQALAFPRVGFRVSREGETMLELPRDQSLADRFQSIMGSSVQHGLLELSFQRDGVVIGGYLARPLSTRGDRRSQFLFVNGRPFSSKTISAAIEQACRGFVMVRRFPIFCVFIDCPPGDVDVNVHPTKEEVRFENERSIAGACYHAVRIALEETGEAVEVSLSEEQGPKGVKDRDLELPQRPSGIPSEADFFRSPMAMVNRAFDRKRARDVQTDWTALAAKLESQQPVGREIEPALTPPPEDNPLDAPAAPPTDHGAHNPIAAGPGEKPDLSFWSKPYEPEPLGQIAETYILVRFGGDLLIVDQHAAHERIRFIELLAQQRQIASQPLLTPETFEVTPTQLTALEALTTSLSEMGFEVEPFGGRTFAITAIPADLTRVNPVTLITDLLDEFEDQKKINRVQDMRESILIRAACHSAIRAGQRLAIEEMRALLNQMRRHKLSFTCPHGRPTIIRLTKDELDKKFCRIV